MPIQQKHKAWLGDIPVDGKTDIIPILCIVLLHLFLPDPGHLRILLFSQLAYRVIRQPTHDRNVVPESKSKGTFLARLELPILHRP